MSVPGSLPFEQQVSLAQQQCQAAANSQAVANSVIHSSGAQDRASECKALDPQVKHYDAMARQPQTGPTQDWITAQKRKARDRQFSIRC